MRADCPTILPARISGTHVVNLEVGRSMLEKKQSEQQHTQCLFHGRSFGSLAEEEEIIEWQAVR